VKYNHTDTAIVVIDPQNDVLSPTGTSWEVVGASVIENRTVENLIEVLAAAKAGDYSVFISPHYFYPPDHRWLFNGPLEADELRTHTFARVGPLNLDGLAGSGADWLDELKPFIEDSTTVVCSPHKVWGP
jgi:nicotinamidase-related amidase